MFQYHVSTLALVFFLLNASSSIAAPKEEAVDLSMPAATPAPTAAPNSAVRSGRPVSPRAVDPRAADPRAAANAGGGMKQKGVGFAAYGPPAGTPGMSSPMNFKVYFDLNLYNRPGVADLTFDNFHPFLFLEASPMPEMQFSFDVSSSPRFYELDWQFTPTLQFRAGKIWIPFDDTAPHNIYGGRTSVSKLSIGVPFLPDLWTDLGVGLKWNMLDIANINLVGDIYFVNGFRGEGRDPTTGSSVYPSFSDLPTGADNNENKAVGGRVHGVFWNSLGLGVSAYKGRWSDKKSASYGLLITGGDLQYRFLPLSEIRLGIASMSFDALSGKNIVRGGSYLEYGQFMSKNRAWKLLFRGGTLQMDDRVIDVNDQQIVGATIVYRPNILQFSLEHSRDLQKFATKTSMSYTNLRMVVSF